jgi:CHAT domain-containing protein
LVALSACETGLTEFRRLPDEAIGLPAGLLLAGTPGVVATLWAVNDLSTALLMIKFYELLLKGAPQSGAGPLLPAQALCGAQRWLRAVTADELFAYFQRHKMRRQPFSLTAAKRMPAEVADEGVLQFALLDKGRPPYEDPYFWAPFIFIGE